MSPKHNLPDRLHVNGIGGEPEPPLGLESFNRLHQAHMAFRDHVCSRQTLDSSDEHDRGAIARQPDCRRTANASARQSRLLQIGSFASVLDWKCSRCTDEQNLSAARRFEHLGGVGVHVERGELVAARCPDVGKVRRK